MARKEIDVRIAAEGRDKGKTFRITEASASVAEGWIVKLLLLAAQRGASVGEAMAGLSGMVMAGVQAVVGGVSYEEIKPLLDEMFVTVTFVPDGRPEMHRKLIEDDIEEVGTRMKLREEVINLHMGFSLADALSSLRRAPAQTTDQPKTSGSESAQTYPLQ